ncbi:hypothetical protein ACJX0J_002257 (mitochondrion) [Zea mays]
MYKHFSGVNIRDIDEIRRRGSDEGTEEERNEGWGWGEPHGDDDRDHTEKEENSSVKIKSDIPLIMPKGGRAISETGREPDGTQLGFGRYGTKVFSQIFLLRGNPQNNQIIVNRYTTLCYFVEKLGHSVPNETTQIKNYFTIGYNMRRASGEPKCFPFIVADIETEQEALPGGIRNCLETLAKTLCPHLGSKGSIAHDEPIVGLYGAGYQSFR